MKVTHENEIQTLLSEYLVLFAPCTLQSLSVVKVLELSHMILPLGFTWGSTILPLYVFNDVSDCRVQCANVARNPETTGLTDISQVLSAANMLHFVLHFT